MGTHDSAKRHTTVQSTRARVAPDARRAGQRGARSLLSAVLALGLASAGLATAAAETWDGTVSGELLEVVVETEGAATEEHVVVSDDGEVSQVDGDAVEQIEPGATVEVAVSGAEAESATLLEPASETAALDAHHVYVVTLDDASASGDVTLADAVANAEYAADYWIREARGAIASFDVTDSTTLTWDGSCSASYSQLWSTASAEFPGVSFSGEGNHLIVYTPASCSYSYAGVATVGSMSAGGYVHISSLGPATTVHEIGHNLGLGHANALWGDPYGDYGFAEYYGVYGPQAGSVGSLQPGGLDAAYRYYLDLPGWEAATQTIDADTAVRETRTVTLSETTSGSGTTAITIVDPSDGYRYFLDFRSAQGVDSSTFYALSYSKLSVQGLFADYSPGVVVTWMPAGRDIEVVGQVDGADLWTSLQAGDSYAAPDGLFSVTVVSSTATSATVEIATGPAPVDPVPSTTTLTVGSVYQGTSPTADIGVSAAETPAGSVEVFLDGAHFADVTLVEGDASVSLPDDLEIGGHEIRAVYAGSGAVSGSEDTETITVAERTPTTLEATARTAAYGDRVKVSVAVGGAEGAGGTVTASYNGAEWTASVRDDGRATLWMPKAWKTGERELAVRYNGTATHAPSEASVTAVTVKAVPGIDVSFDRKPRKGSRATVEVTVQGPLYAWETGTVRVYVDGRPASNTVTLKREGGVYTASVRTWRLPKGKVTVTYTSENSYLVSTRYWTGIWVR